MSDQAVGNIAQRRNKTGIRKLQEMFPALSSCKYAEAVSRNYAENSIYIASINLASHRICLDNYINMKF